MNSFLDAVSAFFLKHPPDEFARGDLGFAPVMHPVAVIALVVAAAVVTVVAVGRLHGITRRDRAVLAGLRVLALLLIGVCLMRPTLMLSRAVAQRNVLAVVYDDSRSMTTADQHGDSRLAAVETRIGDSAAVTAALRQRFVVRSFRLAGAATPIGSSRQLTGTGARSDLGAGLAAVREALADQPLAGIVLVSDGAQNGTTDLDAELARLAARGIPVHTVGVGSTRFATDVGVEAMALPDQVLLGGVAPAELTLSLRGVAGRTLQLTSEVGGRLASVDTVRAPAGRDLMRVPLQLPVTQAGDLPVRVSVTPLDGETTIRNNRATGVLRVRAGPEKILYVEGEPRSELPFLRRAVASDSALQVVALVRTAEGKYLRLGVDDSLELRDGFPATAAELFRYRAVVLGSVEASYFGPAAQRMLQDFVSVRGGGVLALGGRAALAEGGYTGTPVGEMLPLELTAAVRGAGETAPATKVRVRPPASGDGTPWSLGLVGVSSWDSLPELTVVNTVGRPRAGASVELEGVPPNQATPLPVFVTQRFGRGHTGVFLPQDAWRWQMTMALPPDDRSLEAFWTRMMRWLVSGVPDRLTFDAGSATGAPGDPVPLRVAVVDSTWQPPGDARVTVRVTPPDADPYQVSLSSDLAATGEFTGQLVPNSEGVWRLTAVARLGDDSLVADRIAVVSRDAEDPGRMERDDEALRRIADRTGGHAYDIDRLDALPREVAITRSGITARTASDLWDAPAMFLLMVILLGTEWAWRRTRGLG